MARHFYNGILYSGLELPDGLIDLQWYTTQCTGDCRWVDRSTMVHYTVCWRLQMG